MEEELKSKLREFGIVPQDFGLYITAFTHRSFLNEVKEPIPSNERLEFLGDAVLSFIISDHLYQNFPQYTEGELTNLRAYLVKTDSLARVAKFLNLGSFLRMSKGEELSGGRENTQILANTFEALLGATFKDAGVNKAKEFIHSTLIPQFAEEIKSGAPKDAKSTLQEIVQSKLQASPKYKTISSTGPDHAKQFVIGVYLRGEQIGLGEGSNKHAAEEEAAKQALINISKRIF